MKTVSSNWVSRLCKFSKFVDRDGENEKTAQQYVQWMTSDDSVYAPASKNVKELKPGFYEIISPMSGGIFFERIKMGKEGLIHFPETTSDHVVDEIEKFWDREGLFRESKIAFKRGILLYGPPGSGKTCTIKLVIENVIKRNGVVIKFSSPGLFESGMNVLREIQPKTPIVVLMEDLDAILARYNESDVINILDGVISVDKIVFLATTNYPEKLGSRILNRPSRFDKRFEIGMPNPESRKIYLESIGGSKLSAGEVTKWVTDTGGLSISHLKELFVAVKILGDEYKNALATLKNMKIKLDSNQFDEYGRAEG